MAPLHGGAIFVEEVNVVRKLMWASVGFAGFGTVYAYWLHDGLQFVAFGALVFGICLLRLRWKNRILRPAIAVLIGVALGAGWFSCYENYVMCHIRAAHGLTQQYTFTVSDYSYPTAYGSGVDGVVRLGNREFSGRIWLNEPMELEPGDEICGSFRLEAVAEGGNCWGDDFIASQKSQVRVEKAEKTPLRYYPAVLRKGMVERIELTFPKDTAFFAKAVFLGDRSDVDYQTQTAFKISGISHIIAVSGLHVSILFSLVFLFSGKRRFLTALIGIPVVVLFAAVTGFSPSITRACLMQILMMLALLFDREYDPPTALSFAALVMVAADPMVIASVSFQLSVGCMAGIFLFSERIRSWMEGLFFWSKWRGKTFRVRFRTWIACGIAVTLSSMFFTAPLVGYYFGAVSLIGVLTNLLVLWAVNLIFYGIMVCMLLSMFWFGGAAALGWLISWPIRYVLLVSRWLSRIPLAAVYTCSDYVVLWLVLCYVLTVLFLIFRKRQAHVLVCCCALGLCAALLFSWIEPLRMSCTMTVLDVGQGQCVLLQAKGRTFVIDCGGDSDTEAADLAADTLLSQGISRVDGLILTHFDRDHAGGVAYFLSRIPADAVYLPEGPDEEALAQTIYPVSGDAAWTVTEDLTLEWTGNRISIFAPVMKQTSNESGLSVLFHNENCDILITGDMSQMGERLLLTEKQIPPLTVLVAGHHGAKTSTGEVLLRNCHPQYTLISVGADNRYGHPHEDVLQRLEHCGSQILRTDLSGTIIFRR